MQIMCNESRARERRCKDGREREMVSINRQTPRVTAMSTFDDERVDVLAPNLEIYAWICMTETILIPLALAGKKEHRTTIINDCICASCFSSARLSIVVLLTEIEIYKRREERKLCFYTTHYVWFYSVHILDFLNFFLQNYLIEYYWQQDIVTTKNEQSLKMKDG